MQNFMCYSKLLCFILNLRAISEYKPPGACNWRDDLSEGFCITSLGGLHLEGLIFGILWQLIRPTTVGWTLLQDIIHYFIIKIIIIIVTIIITLKCHFSVYAGNFKYVFLYMYMFYSESFEQISKNKVKTLYVNIPTILLTSLNVADIRNAW